MKLETLKIPPAAEKQIICIIILVTRYSSTRVPCTSYSKIHGSYDWIGILQSYSKPIKCGQMAISFLFWPNGHSHSFCGWAAIPILGYLSTIEFPTKQITELGRGSFQNAEAFSKVKMHNPESRKHNLIHCKS